MGTVLEKTVLRESAEVEIKMTLHGNPQKTAVFSPTVFINSQGISGV
jgi:hypothetical protein